MHNITLLRYSCWLCNAWGDIKLIGNSQLCSASFPEARYGPTRFTNHSYRPFCSLFKKRSDPHSKQLDVPQKHLSHVGETCKQNSLSPGGADMDFEKEFSLKDLQGWGCSHLCQTDKEG